LPDSAVHTEGALDALIRQVLDMVDPGALSPLDAVLATKLGGYTDMPPMPALAAAAQALPTDPKGFMELVRAGMMIAAASKNKDAMLSVLEAMRAFADALPQMGEAALLPAGADALRVAAELYRRTGQRFLLALMERLRAQLPDVSGLFHSFPFQKPFQPEAVAEGAVDEAAQYHRRMKMLGTGALTCDALAITAQLAMFSGSARDANASKAGVTALQRFHGMPHGAFAANPYLAGRDLSRASDLPTVCALLEALLDLLCASGDVAYAERMERIAENALAGFLQPGGVCAAQAVNRFAGDATCLAAAASPSQITALLRALYAVRRAVWMVRGEAELAMLLPYEGCCLARMDGTPVRICVRKEGTNTLTLTVEAKQPTEFTLQLHVPGYAAEASVSVNGGKALPAACGKLHAVKRLFRTGDTVTLALDCPPFVETGYRASASVYLGPLLMALPLPDGDAAWQYALRDTAEPVAFQEAGRPRVHVDACLAPAWAASGGVIQPPPQGVPPGEMYELTLLPYAETQGRIAAFPQAARRA
jgi:hypothetical protein